MKINFFRSLAVSLAAFFVIVTGAYAYTALRQIPVYIEIISGPKTLQVYSEPTLAVPINSIKIAIFRRGTTDVKPLWLKNTGVEPFDLSVRGFPEAPSWGEVTYQPTDFGTLLGGETANMTMTIYVFPTTPAGNVTYQMEFYEP